MMWKLGVAAKLLASLTLLMSFIVIGGGLAILSFNQFHSSFNKVASDQLATMVSAAQLGQHTEALTSLAPALFAKELNPGSLTSFSTKTFRLKSDLRKLIETMTDRVEDTKGLTEIDASAQALFSNANRLATKIFDKAALQNDIRNAIKRITESNGVLVDRRDLPNLSPASHAAMAASMFDVANLNRSALLTLSGQSLQLATPKKSQLTQTYSNNTQLAWAVPYARSLEGATNELTEKHQRLAITQSEIDTLLLESDQLSRLLNDAVGALVQSVRADIASQNQVLGDVLTQRTQLMMTLVLLGFIAAGSTAFYLQFSVIGRLNTLRDVIRQSSSTPARDNLFRSNDEISDMARAVTNYVDELQRRDRDLQLSQSRLTNAIESMTDGFSLYDSDDSLVMCNSKYRTLLYSGMEDLVQPGQSFEVIIRAAAQRGLIANAKSDLDGWVINRLALHRKRESTTTQQRSDGRWIEIRERKTEGGDTVAVYADITERRQFVQEIMDAKQAAEVANQELAHKNQMLEALSSKLAKYLAPQVYSSIFAGKHSVEVSSARKKLTVFFSDIVDFTATTDRLESEELTNLLNGYLTEMSEIALQYGATIDKFIGDAIMVFFGDPETKGPKEDALACVRMAIAMQARMHGLRSEWANIGLSYPFELRIGINTGFCTVGNFGSEDRVDYTIIGGEVNAAARLQSHADTGGILIGQETYSLVKDEIVATEQSPISAKGFDRALPCYKVYGLRIDIEEIHSGPFGTLEKLVDMPVESLTTEDAAKLRHTAEELLRRLKDR